MEVFAVIITDDCIYVVECCIESRENWNIRAVKASKRRISSSFQISLNIMQVTSSINRVIHYGAKNRFLSAPLANDRIQIMVLLLPPSPSSSSSSSTTKCSLF